MLNNVFKTWSKTTRLHLDERTIWYQSNFYSHLIGSCIAESW